MTDQEITALMDIEIFRCDPEWGGTWAYKTVGENCSICGFKSKKQLINRVLRDRVGGDSLGRLMMKLLRKHQTKNKKK